MPSEPLLKPIYKNVIRFLGDSGSPADILRRRRWTMQTMRRLGTPVLIRHMFNIDDVDDGIAEPSPNFDSIYDQPIHDDPFSFGVGYVAVEKADKVEPQEWIKPATARQPAELVQGLSEEGFLPAPLYRGYGPGYLTYVILPDRPVDIFKLTEAGALIKTQEARVQLPWYPEVGDNDVMITVELDEAERIIGTGPRYQLKKVN